MRPIDADALIKVFESWFVEVNCNPETGHTPFDAVMLETANEVIADAIRAIGGAETLDAVPVVRCKDCKHRFTLDCPMRHEELTYDEDDGYDWIDHDYTSDDRFCNEGARMDGDANEKD